MPQTTFYLSTAKVRNAIAELFMLRQQAGLAAVAQAHCECKKPLGSNFLEQFHF